MLDIITEIIATARRNKLRTALTGFAVAWGIFMLIFLLGAGNGLINALEDSTGRFMDQSMSVHGGITSKAYEGLRKGRSIQLNEKDFQTTSHDFSQNVTAAGVVVRQRGVQVSHGPEYVQVSLRGVHPEEITINRKTILCGRFVNNIDMQEKRKVIVLSDTYAKELMPTGYERLVGQHVKVGQMAFQVVGIYKADRSGMADDAYTAVTTMRSIYNKGDKVDEIYFSFSGLNTMEENQSFEKTYRGKLNKQHQAAADDESTLWIWNRFTQALQMNTGMSIIRIALWIIGLFTLLSGIVGVSNIMLITVKERTHEFGIRKAIGATPGSLLRLIIVESVIITTFFGYLGMLAGIFANHLMDITVGQEHIDFGEGEHISVFLDPTVSFQVCVAATIVMIVAGMIAGLVPARKAARVRPIEALRAE